MGDERRKYERLRIPLEARWEGTSCRHAARIYDISLSGCYVEALTPVTQGERIELEIQLPTARWLRLQGEVVHAQPNMGFGVSLTDLREQDRFMLERLLEYASGE